MAEEEKVVVGSGEVGGTNGQSGSLSGSTTYSGALNGSINDDSNLSGAITDNAELAGKEAATGSLSAVNSVNGVSTASLSVHFGVDGKDGADGFSPTITVEKDTKTEYVLKVTNKNGSYLTPNLYPDLEGLQDVASLVASKVDEDLKEYTQIDPLLLTSAQRDESFLYTNAVGLNAKIRISDVALQKETEERIKQKLQTVVAIPRETDWHVGDYILLDVMPTDDNGVNTPEVE